MIPPFNVWINMVLVGLATYAVIMGLHYLFGGWGIIIFWSGVLAYLLKLVFEMQASINR